MEQKADVTACVVKRDGKRADKTSGRNSQNAAVTRARQLIKEYPVTAWYHGNQAPEMVSAVIIEPTLSAVCGFSVAIRFSVKIE